MDFMVNDDHWAFLVQILNFSTVFFGGLFEFFLFFFVFLVQKVGFFCMKIVFVFVFVFSFLFYFPNGGIRF